MTRGITQTSIAKQLGLSRGTVAAALHPHLSARLRPEVRDRVRLVADEMGYVPHHAGRRLALTRGAQPSLSFDQVALVYIARRDIKLDYVSLDILGGAEQELSRFGAALTFVRVHTAADWTKVDRLLRAGMLDGCLLYGDVTDEAVARFESVPHVILGNHHCRRPVDSADVDDEAVGRLAARYLGAQGHREVGYFDGPSLYLYQARTREGFCSEAKVLGLKIHEHVHLESPAFESGTTDWLTQVLRPAGGMTAVFTPECFLAGALLPVLRALKIDVPGDLSVLAYELSSEDILLQSFCRVEIPMGNVGAAGAALLHRLVTDSLTDGSRASRTLTAQTIKVPARLVKGPSVRRLS